MAREYKDLIVWKKSMELAKAIYLLTDSFPKEEIYALTNQMRRAAISIPSNVAEGQARQSSREFLQYLYIARDSKAELETQLLLAKDLGYFDGVPEQQIAAVLSLTDEVGKMLFTIITKLSTDH